MSTPDVILLVACGLLACVGTWVALQLAMQNGRLMLRIEVLEQHLAGMAQLGVPTGNHLGLPPGSVLNDFSLPVLSGGAMTLLQWRGNKVALIFVSPKCPHSVKLLPQLAEAWKTRAPQSPMPIIITTGDVAENRRMFEEHGIQFPVLLQEDTEVAFLHHALVTPMAYLVDEGGFTIGPAAVGGRAILELLLNGQSSSNDHTPAGVSQGVPGSRIVRDGLRAGTPAPEFTLPGLDGTSISLSDFRGRPVLLVFSDPDCQPCQEMAPLLERIHRGSSDLAIVMISRGSPEANRAKVRAQGLTFPVVLQHKWEVSREYGMFATPIGYMIDETGVLASGVAVGASAILELAGQQQCVGAVGTKIAD
jgi:peroxiredoxin